MSQIECFNCKQKGHYSSNCPKQSGGRKSVACVNVVPDNSDGEIANAVGEAEEEPTSDEEQSPANEEVGDMDRIFQDGGSDRDDKDVGSLNDWCGHVRIDEDSEGEEEEVAEVWSSAICLLPEDKCLVAELLKVLRLDDGQVAYCLHSTKDLGQLQVEDGPRRDFRSLGVIKGYMRINGHKAHILLDGGSTINMISANFTSIYKLDLFQLKKPMKLQMATSGSHSIINFGVKAEIECGDYSQTCYFDIVNLDRYQVVLGTPFLKQHGVILNYTGSGSFKLGD